MKQNTIKKKVSFSGHGLHSGKTSNMTFLPADEGTGVVIRRTDLEGKPAVKASIENTTGSERGTNLGIVNTIEHVLSALYAMGIHNIYMELDGPEPPASDGSSIEFCRAIEAAGIARLRGEYPMIRVDRPAVLIDGDSAIAALPHNGLAVSFMINYPSDFIGSQFLRFDLDKKAFVKEIAPARTYGFVRELEELHAKGLAAGANEGNAVVIGEKGYLTPLRFNDELVRHKILDLIGDISLLNSEINAHIVCVRTGHKMNLELARKLKEVG